MRKRGIVVSILAPLAVLVSVVTGFQNVVRITKFPSPSPRCSFLVPSFPLFASDGQQASGETSDDLVSVSDDTGSAATNTINERLLAELQEATKQEKYGARSAMGKKLGLSTFQSPKNDEQRQAAIEEARNLNGVNPLVALGGGLFALAVAGGLWALTNFLAEFFALHPVVNDVYFVQRVAAVLRNVVMGLVSLASGFFGVTGAGILFLGLRVAYGVMTGELDPTPLKKSRQEESALPNVWDLMMNKKPGRRGGKKGDDNKPFGL